MNKYGDDTFTITGLNPILFTSQEFMLLIMLSLTLQGILRNQWHPAKVLNSEFYLYPRSKPNLQSCLIDSQDFLTQTAQGSRHIKAKNKIVNMVDTFSGMASDSPVPVLSGTHSTVLRRLSVNDKCTYLILLMLKALALLNFGLGFSCWWPCPKKIIKINVVQTLECRSYLKFLAWNFNLKKETMYLWFARHMITVM